MIVRHVLLILGSLVFFVALSLTRPLVHAVLHTWAPLQQRGWTVAACLGAPSCYEWWQQAIDTLYRASVPIPHPAWAPVALYLTALWAVGAAARLPRPTSPLYDARWASPRQVRPLRYRPKPATTAPVALPLVAIPNGHVLALHANERRELGHVLVCAPSRSGKGLWLTYALLTWPSSAIVLDPKGELYRLTAGFRRQIGRVVVLDPAGRGTRYDPIRELDYSVEGLQAAANLITQPEQEGHNAIFAQRASLLLTAMLLAARHLRLPALVAVRALIDLPADQLLRYLKELNDPEITRLLTQFSLRDPAQFDPNILNEDRFLSSAWGVLQTRLAPLLTPGILAMVSGSEFRASSLFDRPTTLYVTFAESEMEHTHAALRLVLLAIVTALLREADARATDDRIPVLLALDEAGRIPIPRLPDLVSTVAGRGLSVATVVQSTAQLRDAYGPDGAHTIVANAFAQLYWSTHDLQTAEDVTRLLGQRTVAEQRYSLRERLIDVDPVRMVGQRPRELLTPDEFRQLPKDRVIALVGEYPPILGYRLDWRQHRWMVDLTRIPPPPVAPIPQPDVPDLRPTVASSTPTAEQPPRSTRSDMEAVPE